MTPSLPIEKLCSEPIGEPSWLSAASVVRPANWRSASGSAAVPKSIVTGPEKDPSAAGIVTVGGVVGVAMLPVAGLNVSVNGAPMVSGLVSASAPSGW